MCIDGRRRASAGQLHSRGCGGRRGSARHRGLPRAAACITATRRNNESREHGCSPPKGIAVVNCQLPRLVPLGAFPGPQLADVFANGRARLDFSRPWRRIRPGRRARQRDRPITGRRRLGPLHSARPTVRRKLARHLGPCGSPASKVHALVVTSGMVPFAGRRARQCAELLPWRGFLQNALRPHQGQPLSSIWTPAHRGLPDGAGRIYMITSVEVFHRPTNHLRTGTQFCNARHKGPSACDERMAQGSRAGAGPMCSTSTRRRRSRSGGHEAHQVDLSDIADYCKLQ